MSIVAWLILGLLAGFIASQIVNQRGAGPGGVGILLDMLLGIVGAMVGGWLFSLFGAREVTGLDLYSLVVATVGAVLVLLAYHALTDSGRWVNR